jgi:DNA-binding NarL/FixJ family response regulator
MIRTYSTDADLRDMVVETLRGGGLGLVDDLADDFDIDAIVADLVHAADRDGTYLRNVPEGEEFWAIVARHDVSANRSADAADSLIEAAQAHDTLGVLETQAKSVRSVRDEAIRSAIAGGITMYAIARTLGISEQAVSRIRDRG